MLTLKQIIEDFHNKFDTMTATYSEGNKVILKFTKQPEVDEWITQTVQTLLSEIPVEEIDTGEWWNPADPSGGKEIGYNQHCQEIAEHNKIILGIDLAVVDKENQCCCNNPL